MTYKDILGYGFASTTAWQVPNGTRLLNFQSLLNFWKNVTPRSSGQVVTICTFFTLTLKNLEIANWNYQNSCIYYVFVKTVFRTYTYTLPKIEKPQLASTCFVNPVTLQPQAGVPPWMDEGSAVELKLTNGIGYGWISQCGVRYGAN